MEPNELQRPVTPGEMARLTAALDGTPYKALTRRMAFELELLRAERDRLAALTLKEIERWAIERRIALMDVRIGKTAASLGMPERTLYEKRRQYRDADEEVSKTQGSVKCGADR